MNLILWGLILNFFGSAILVFVSLFGNWHQTMPNNHWTKRYWWMGRQPFYKDTKTHNWHFKWKRIVTVEGCIPPRYMWNAIGFLYITAGFFLQIIGL
jgi:hypothetical protein